MQITLIQGIFIGIVADLGAIENSLEFTMIYRPLPMAALTGIVLGDVSTACVVGAYTELAFAGLMPVGGASVPHGTMAGIMSAVLCISQGVPAEQGLTLSLPFAYLLQYVDLAKSTLYSFFDPIIEKIAITGDAKKLVRFHMFTLVLLMFIYGLTAFICSYAAQDLIAGIIAATPERLLHGLQIAGGLMPAVGFCMMLSIILKKEFMSFLILGFVLSCFFNATNALPFALIGLSISLFYYFFVAKNTDNNKEEGESDGI